MELILVSEGTDELSGSDNLRGGRTKRVSLYSYPVHLTSRKQAPVLKAHKYIFSVFEELEICRVSDNRSNSYLI